MPAPRYASLQEDAYLRSLTGQPYGSPQPIVNCWQVSGPFDTDAFGVALDRLAAAHPALRRHFPDDRGRVADPAACPVDLVDAADAAALPALLGRRFRRDIAPLWRTAVVATGPDRHLVGLSFDHLVLDGLSVSMLLADLGRHYDDAVAGHPAAPMRATRTYDDFAAAQRTRLAGAWGRRRREFWQATTRTYGTYPPRCPLGGDPTPAVDAPARVLREIEAAPVRAGVERAAGVGLTLFALGATALFVALAEVTGEPAGGLVADVHGRCLPGYARTAGLFSHGMPVFAGAPSHRPLAAQAGEVQQRIAAAVDHALPLRAVDRLWDDGLVAPAPHLLMHVIDGARRDLRLGDLDVRRVEPAPTDPPPGRRYCELELRLTTPDRVQFAAEHGTGWNTAEVAAVLDRALELLAGGAVR